MKNKGTRKARVEGLIPLREKSPALRPGMKSWLLRGAGLNPGERKSGISRRLAPKSPEPRPSGRGAPLITLLAICFFTGSPAFAQDKTEQAATAMIDVLDLKETDLSDVLKLISQKSGMNIIAGNNVTGKVTLYIKDVSVDDVLKIIAQTHDLAFIRKDNFIQIMTQADYEKIYGHKFFKNTERVIQKLNHCNVTDVLVLLERMKSPSGLLIADDKTNTVVMDDLPQNVADMRAFLIEIDIPRTTRVFELNYAKAEDLNEKIKSLLSPNVGAIHFDKRSNQIYVTDSESKLREIARVIRAFDVKEREVAIEAKIVQVILRDQFKMGIDWQAVVSRYHELTFVTDFDILGAAEKKGQVAIGNLGKDNYRAVLEALSDYGVTNNLSNPHIMVVNNQEAKILVGSTEPYVTSTTTTPSSGPTTTAESVNFIEVGVKLYVTPTIHKDNYVTMKIRPEVSSVTRTVITGNNNTIPVVDTSEAETTVMVKDGATIVIGGLIKDEKIKSVKKVPLLGDIPILGNVFKNTDDFTRKTELVIFLTPRIVSGDGPESAP